MAKYTAKVTRQMNAGNAWKARITYTTAVAATATQFESTHQRIVLTTADAISPLQTSLAVTELLSQNRTPLSSQVHKRAGKPYTRLWVSNATCPSVDSIVNNTSTVCLKDYSIPACILAVQNACGHEQFPLCDNSVLPYTSHTRT